MKKIIPQTVIAVCFVLIVLTMMSMTHPIKDLPEPKLNKSYYINEFKLASIKTPCTGVVRYYSGQGFIVDMGVFMQQYYEKADSNEYNPTSRNMTLLPPNALAYENVRGYDCEDMAFGTYCLAGMYSNVECEPYLNNNLTHIGMDCIIDVGYGDFYRIRT
jgi:hypothetical protein